MKRKAAILMSGLLVFCIVIGLGCGSKETVKYEPENFPEPEPVTKDDVSESSTRTETLPEPVLDKPTPLVLETVHFDFDRSELTSQAKTVLATNARQLQERANVFIRIEGHCDERGTVAYNLALGERRALTVRNYLVNFGIDPGRLSIISYGKERPVDSRSNEAAWAMNRRAEFVILNR